MDKMGIEKACMDVCDDNINMMVPWYIMASYAYYKEDDPILEDNMFDNLAKKLLKDWDQVQHIHKEYLNEDMLKAGTYMGEYPSRVKGALDELRHAYKG